MRESAMNHRETVARCNEPPPTSATSMPASKCAHFSPARAPQPPSCATCATVPAPNEEKAGPNSIARPPTKPQVLHAGLLSRSGEGPVSERAASESARAPRAREKTGVQDPYQRNRTFLTVTPFQAQLRAEEHHPPN